MNKVRVSKQRISYLIIIMAVVSSVVAFSSIGILYGVSFEQQSLRLLEIAQSRARIIEAVSRFDARHSGQNLPGGSFEATLSQITEAHKNFQGFGKTGEFTLAELKGDQITFLLQHRHLHSKVGLGEDEAVQMGTQLAEPMQRVLKGQSGAMIGLDYRGEKVLAAYEPVNWPGRKIGIVTKIDLSEIREPFVKAGLFTALISIAAIILGIIVFKKVSTPLIDNLEESEDRFKSIFESDMIGTFFWDASGEISDANNAFLNIIGYSKDDLLSGRLKWSEMTPPEYAERDNELLKELLDKGVITPYEKEYIHKSGRRIPIMVGAATFAGATASGVAFVLDITERKQTEEALIRSEKLYHSLVEAMNEGLARVDENGTFNYVNEQFCKMLGHSKSEFMGEHWMNFYDEGAQKTIKDQLEKRAKGSTEAYELENTRKDGRKIWLSISPNPIYDEDGNIKGSMGLVQDITERKQAEKELRESEERFRAVFDNALDGILLAEKETRRFLTGNREICYMLGYTLEEIKQLDVGDIHPAESLPHVKEQFYKQTRGEIEVAKDIPVKRKDGGIFYADVKSSSVTLAGKTYLVGLFRDITERKEAEEELHKAYDEMEHKVKGRTKELAEANSKLKELDKLKSMFIASMSHELRTPLNAIIGFTGVILQGMVGDINDKQKDQLGRVYRNARHLLALITDVIDISKLEAGKISPFAEDFVLKEVIDESVDDLMDDIERKDLAIEVNVPPGLQMKSDKRRMLECILNLLSNAVKYTEEGKITIDAKESDGEIEVRVSDTGIGIAGEDLDRLFMPFERLSSHLRIQTPGTGLGLYLCKSLSREVLGGNVLVRSEPGEGSTFTLRVPKEIQIAKTIQSIKEGGKEQ